MVLCIIKLPLCLSQFDREHDSGYKKNAEVVYTRQKRKKKKKAGKWNSGPFLNAE